MNAQKIRGKKQLGRPEFKCEDNIEMDLKGVQWEVVDWFYLAEGRDRLWFF
jgi:hypothetical protein